MYWEVLHVVEIEPGAATNFPDHLIQSKFWIQQLNKTSRLIKLVIAPSWQDFLSGQIFYFLSLPYFHWSFLFIFYLYVLIDQKVKLFVVRMIIQQEQQILF